MALPTFPLKVTIPEYLSPSALVHAKACRLRALGSHFTHDLILPGGPAAERGILFHALLEDAARGRIGGTQTASTDVERAIERLLIAAHSRLAADPATAAYADLPATLPALEWRNVRSRMIDTAVRLAKKAPRPAVPARPGVTRELDLRRLARASEVPIRVSTLRIGGRIDMLEWIGASQLMLRDYKTGNVLDSDGAVRPTVALQLRLYALAVSELLPGVEVRLAVSAGSERQVSFTEQDATETRQWLNEVIESLPAGASVAPDSLASPGSACRTCPIRHACGPYLREAPQLWASGTAAFMLPLDVWGTVLSVELDDYGVSIVLRDVAGRLVRVTRLADRRRFENLTGSLWLFGLEAAVPVAVRGRYLHPRNFHELPGGPLERRAWALAVFR
jgi:RecB family exonuclease